MAILIKATLDKGPYLQSLAVKVAEKKLEMKMIGKLKEKITEHKRKLIELVKEVRDTMVKVGKLFDKVINHSKFVKFLDLKRFEVQKELEILTGHLEPISRSVTTFSSQMKQLFLKVKKIRQEKEKRMVSILEIQ